MFSRASCSVAPCDQQPGKPGTETLYPHQYFEQRHLVPHRATPLDQGTSLRACHGPPEPRSTCPVVDTQPGRVPAGSHGPATVPTRPESPQTGEDKEMLQVDHGRRHMTKHAAEMKGLKDVFDTIRTLLAVRSYQTTPIPDALVRRIVEAGRLTRSGMNGQPWHFVVVRDAETLRKSARWLRAGRTSHRRRWPSSWRRRRAGSPSRTRARRSSPCC